MKFLPTRPLRLLVVAALAILPAFPAAAQPATAAAPVEALHKTLLDGMKRAENLGADGRFRLFEPAVTRNFNMQLMTAIACGTYWRKANESERRSLVEAFTRFSTGTYAARFSGFSGQSFNTLGTRAGPFSTTLVDTQLVRGGGQDPVKLSYVVRKFGEGWRIIDVLLDGDISELAVKRSEFRALLADKGIAGLVKSLTERTNRVLGKKG